MRKTDDELRDEIRAKIELVNQRFKELENVDDAVSEEDLKKFINNQKSRLAIIGNTDRWADKLQVGNIDNFNHDRLEDYNETLDMTLKSKWMSVEGREDILKRKLKSFEGRGYKLSKDELAIYSKLMNNDTVARLIETTALSSWQVLEYSIGKEKSNKLIANVRQLKRAYGQSLTKLSSKHILAMLQGISIVKKNKTLSRQELDYALKEMKRYRGHTKLTKSGIAKLLVDIRNEQRTGKITAFQERYR